MEKPDEIEIIAIAEAVNDASVDGHFNYRKKFFKKLLEFDHFEDFLSKLSFCEIFLVMSHFYS
jgi:hypothetical protein